MNADVPKMIQFGVVAKKLQQNTATKKNMAMEHPNTLLDLGKVLYTKYSKYWSYQGRRFM